MSRTDRLLADLERGFAALEDGQIDTAGSILERCRRIDRKHPDVVALAGAVALANGDPDDALAQYRTLAELRPDDAMPRICIARIELHDNGDPDAALDTLEAAFDFIDEEADLIEAIYIKTEALLARDEPEAAREALSELATSAIDDGSLALDLADLALAAEDPAAATRWVESARTIAKDSGDRGLEADALYQLGRVHEATGNHDAMVATWKQVLALDREAPPYPVQVTDEEIDRIAHATLAELPPKIRELLERVPILVDDLPSEDLIEDGFEPRLLGIFQGTPMPEDGALAPSVTNIHLFKKNLERDAADEEHLADEIRITILHETAHYFGLDDDDLAALGLD